jgi:hypothetical protein
MGTEKRTYWFLGCWAVLWVRNAGAWQMVAWASTPIPAK